jgi:lysophospholipase
VLLQGLTEFLEKYDEVAEELNARGFTVVSVDWRSQGASERIARDNRLAHLGDIEDYDHDLAILVQRLASPGALPVIALAHSLGAHLLLRYLHEHKRRLACAVLVAPMLDIHTGKHKPWQARLAATVLSLWRPSRRPLPGIDDRDPLHMPFEQNRVTSDRTRFERAREKLRQQPFLRINGPSFGWLRAAFRSMRHVGAKSHSEDIITPLLLVGAGKDRIVKTEAIREYVKLLPDADYLEIVESEHEILMETDAIRAEFWRAFDAFVDAQLAKGPGGLRA